MKTPGAQNKKNDDIDEESGMGQDYMEQKYRKENEAKLDALANSVSSIKQISKNIGNQMEEEKGVIN